MTDKDLLISQEELDLIDELLAEVDANPVDKKQEVIDSIKRQNKETK